VAELRVERAAAVYSGRNGPVTVFENLSLTVGAGRFIVALGASGCGKTTLLNLMAGFLRPSAGRIALNGREVQGPGAERGVVFQHDALLPWLNVLDNVAFSLRLRGPPTRERQERARAALALVGLAGFDRHHVWELSGGMRQRVGLARALTADPEVLLLDEPLGALDALTREQMQELLLTVWAQTGKTLFMITHGIEEALLLATDLILLSPRPARIAETLTLDFGRRYLAGEAARQLKADPAFVALRERVTRTLFAYNTPGEFADV
jgi:taurine transport system ATP-binding protein